MADHSTYRNLKIKNLYSDMILLTFGHKINYNIA